MQTTMDKLEDREMYEVTVGNIGKVHQSSRKSDAAKAYRLYVAQSKSDYGRAAGEDITLWHNDEPIREYIGTISEKRDTK